MPTLRTIKKRIRSVRNTKQMTRAMEAVAANKMRRAQLVALAARPYAKKALGILAELEAHGGTVRQSSPRVQAEGLADLHPLFVRREAGKTLVVVITSDKGLCGALNASILNKLQQILRTSDVPNIGLFSGHPMSGDIDFIALGQYGAKWLRKAGRIVLDARKGIGDIADLEDSLPMTEAVLERYRSGEFKEVIVVYANFVSVLRQEAVVRHLLPLTREMIEEIVAGIGGMKSANSPPPSSSHSDFGNANGHMRIEDSRAWNWEYKFEPTKEEILNDLLPRLVEIAMYHMILEANASEHSARMVAMKNASDNAEELLDDLTLNYNKARQAAITRELAEITAGKEALIEQ